MHLQPRGKNTRSGAGSAPSPVGTAACCPPEQEFELNSFLSCYLQSNFPGLPELLARAGPAAAPALPLCPAPNPKERTKEGSEAEPWKHHLSRLLLAMPGALDPPGSVTDGGTQQLSLAPFVGHKYLSGCQVHPGTSCTSPRSSSSRTSPAAQLGGIRAPTSSRHCPQLSIPAGLLSVAL